MIEHIEASVVLFKIRQVCLQNATTAQILATPLPELMEQLLAANHYMDSVTWLFNKFWEDETRETPANGTPLTDPDGKLWPRREFDELSDSEYRLAERLYELAEWGSKLYYYQDFDLRLIIADYKPLGTDTEFIYKNEPLRQWVKDTKLRRLAAVVTRKVYRNAIAKAISENQAIQDHLAETEHGAEPDWCDVEQCEEYTAKVWKALEEVDAHCDEACRLGLTTEEQHVADMLWGWVPHDFDEGLIAASREICQLAATILTKEPMIRSEIGEREYIKKVMPEIQRICNERDVYFDIDDSYSLSRGYLVWWLKDKYWEGRRTEE